jgi:hypothetical protein
MIVPILFSLLISLGSEAACLSDSLKIDKVDLTSIEMKSMEDTVGRFESTMLPKIPSDHEIIIRLEALSPRVNAEIVKENGSVSIVVWGGMLSHPKMSPATLNLLLCHELGHYLGGPPLKSRTGWSSTEGQSDYYSTSNCLKDLGVDETQFINSAIALTAIYAEATQQLPPHLEECDQTVATRMNYGYPTIQCRLDTLIAGWNERPRPKCWFIE